MPLDPPFVPGAVGGCVRNGRPRSGRCSKNAGHSSVASTMAGRCAGRRGRRIGICCRRPQVSLQHSWYYFAVFAAVIAGLMTEPLPNAAVALIGLSLAALLSPVALFDAQIQTRPDFSVARQTINWALSGFSNPTVWLIAAAFMFALGYQKSGLQPPHRPSAGAVSGPEYIVAWLCLHLCRRAAGALHTVQHRTRFRHRVSDREQPATAL